MTSGLPFRVGDVIEVELDYDGHKATLIGEAWVGSASLVRVAHYPIASHSRGPLAPFITFIRVVPPALPDEPPDRSVVLDRWNRPWQLRDGFWSWGHAAYVWAQLNKDRGPLRLMVPAPDPLAVDE